MAANFGLKETTDPRSVMYVGYQGKVVEPSDADIQQLVGLLGSLMPLLLRLQSQVFPQQAFPQQAFPSQAFPSQAFEPSLQGGFGNFAAPNPALDRQAAENFIGDIITEQLRLLSAYLEVNAGQRRNMWRAKLAGISSQRGRRIDPGQCLTGSGKKHTTGERNRKNSVGWTRYLLHQSPHEEVDSVRTFSSVPLMVYSSGHHRF